jgi:hypothetical protein
LQKYCCMMEVEAALARAHRDNIQRYRNPKNEPKSPSAECAPMTCAACGRLLL